MELVHNDLYMLKEHSHDMPEGIYRVLAVMPQQDMFFAYFLPNFEGGGVKYSGSKNLFYTNLKTIKKLIDDVMIIIIESEAKVSYINNDLSEYEEKILSIRYEVMEDFLNLEILYDHLRKYKTLNYLVSEIISTGKVGFHSIWKYIYALATNGWSRESLSTKCYNCGGPGKPRLSESGVRKNGRYSSYDIEMMTYDYPLKYHQMAITEEDEIKIIKAYEKLFRGKKWPDQEEMHKSIIKYAYVTKMILNDEGNLEEPNVKDFCYPNIRQVMRICKKISKRYYLRIHNKSKHHNKLKGKALLDSSQSLVNGPGHVYAIDATIGDTYLVCSWDRTKELGRPTVYFIVDVYSSAIVSYYIGLDSPSKKIMDLALFNIGCPIEFLNKILGFEGKSSFKTEVLKPVILLSDNGEAKQRNVTLDAFAREMHLAYAPPYKADMKGVVEVKFSLLSSGMSGMPGSFKASTDYYERKKIKKFSCLTLHEYRIAVDNWVYLYNTTSDRTKLLTPELIANGCDGTPASIYDSGKIFSQSGGKFDLERSMHTYLPTVEATHTEHGIKANGLYYSQQDKQAIKDATKARNHKRSDLIAVYHPDSLNQIWIKNSDRTGYIEIGLTETSRRLYENYSKREYSILEGMKTILISNITHKRLKKLIAISAENEELANQSKVLKQKDEQNKPKKDNSTVRERRVAELGLTNLSLDNFDISEDIDEGTHSNHQYNSEIELLQQLARKSQ